MTCSGRNLLPSSCYWHGDQSSLLPWQCIPCIQISWLRDQHLEIGCSDPRLCSAQPWLICPAWCASGDSWLWYKWNTWFVWCEPDNTCRECFPLVLWSIPTAFRRRQPLVPPPPLIPSSTGCHTVPSCSLLASRLPSSCTPGIYIYAFFPITSHFKLKMVATRSMKCWYPTTTLHGVTTQDNSLKSSPLWNKSQTSLRPMSKQYEIIPKYFCTQYRANPFH
jgi:hypothetical protein